MGGPTRIILLLVAVALVWAAPQAHARDFNCDASALRVQLGTAPAIEPVTANRGASTCKEVKSQTSTQSGPVSGGALIAETSVTGTQAQARGGLGSLSVGPDALAGIPIPTLDAVDQLPAVTVPLPPPLTPSIQVDIRPAVKALVTGVTTGPLLEVTASVVTARARCAGSQPRLSGETSVAALKVLGQTLPTDAAVQRALTVYNGQTINPTALDLSKIVLRSRSTPSRARPRRR